jgi:hypothetical protein
MLIAIATSKELKKTKDPDRVEGIGWCGGGALNRNTHVLLMSGAGHAAPHFIP